MKTRTKYMSMLEKFMKIVEVGGNKLPHPLVLFTYLTIFILILSFILAKLNVSVTYLTTSKEGLKEVTVNAYNLLSKEFFRTFVKDFVNIYIRFFPIGLVVVMMFGVSVAEKSGLISALMKKLVFGAPDYLVTFIVAIVGICANLASDAGIVFAPAIGGAVFFALGRHPFAGIMTGYVAAYGGFSANLLVAGTDALLAGITQSIISGFTSEPVNIHPLMNWFVMASSTIMLATVVTIVTEKIITPILGKFDPADETLKVPSKEELTLTETENKGLKAVGITTIIFILGLFILSYPKNAFFRNASGNLLPTSPLTQGLMFIIFLYFMLIGYFYGKVTKTITSGKDIAKFMQSGLEGVSGFLIVCLPASMFIHFFTKSNISTLIGVGGAHFVERMNISGVPLVVMLVLLTAFMNLFISSGTSKWMIIGPIFVPMFYMLGIHPATTQMAYRIGDSTTNIISPVSAYIPVILGMMEKYRSKNQELGIGSVLSLTVPYSIILLISWTIFFTIWLLIGLPMGPGAPAFL